MQLNRGPLDLLSFHVQATMQFTVYYEEVNHWVFKSDLGSGCGHVMMQQCTSSTRLEFVYPHDAVM
jgi:hypothetical protein